MELTRRAMNCDPGEQDNKDNSGSLSDIGLALTTSKETSDLAKEQNHNQSFDISPGRKAFSTDQPRMRSVSRGRRAPQSPDSTQSIASNLSSGMIRTAVLGQALQDPTIVNVPPSLASSRKNSERMCSSSDVDRLSDRNSCDDEGRHGSKDGNRGRDKSNYNAAIRQIENYLCSTEPSSNSNRRSTPPENSTKSRFQEDDIADGHQEMKSPSGSSESSSRSHGPTPPPEYGVEDSSITIATNPTSGPDMCCQEDEYFSVGSDTSSLPTLRLRGGQYSSRK